MTSLFSSIISWIESGDVWVLAFISFIESFISPILPDILLVPLSLKYPERAIEFAVICIVANIVGGYIGYGIGYYFGPPAMHKFVPPRHQATLKGLVTRKGAWAIFIASILPIPFKIISISAGAMRVPLKIFTVAAILGRTKRFLPIGIILHFFGEDILLLWDAYSSDITWTVIVIVLVGALWYWLRRR